ncbi:hypothetical protein B296_00038090 [Ensete ventricosum]|uniref:Uncharacterized protein n=1 Tax=Ensete ventricosum TaxID=4639 RepID=A0A426Z5X5_ENSVE|nr:hypothetical protein B296_00038090 [Ensete ventricosum]
MRRELAGNSPEVTRSSPIGGWELIGNLLEVAGNLRIGGRELTRSSSKIEGVSLQRPIVWIPLERRTLDLLHFLHPDLEYSDIRSP